MVRPLCSWSFSPDRQKLALSDCNGTVRFVAVPSLRGLGRLGTSSRVLDAASLAWLTPTRMLAIDRANGSVATLLVVDTAAKRVVRRVELGGVFLARAVVGERMVVLLAPFNTIGPARLVVVDANGDLRSVTVDIGAGSHFASAPDGGPAGEVRTPGFAVDPGGTAYVVDADLRVAAVDLATMHVAYHGPTRAPAKALNGTTRVAAWLGRGKLAVSGVDYATTGAGKDTPSRRRRSGCSCSTQRPGVTGRSTPLRTASWPTARGCSARPRTTGACGTPPGRTSTTSRRRATRGSYLRSATPTCAPSAG